MSTKIGRGTVIRGNVRGDGELELEGHFEGSFELDGDVTVADSGRARLTSGKLSARRVVVRGAVAGDIEGSLSIVLEEGARVVGDLAAPSIGIRPGGLLRGHVSTGDVPGAGATRTASAKRNAPARAAAPVAKAAPAARPAPPPAKAKVAPPPAKAKRGAPAPVMPAPKKGKKAQIKKRG